MESLRENTALLYSLFCTGSFIVLLALGWMPEVSEQFGIIDFPDDVRKNIKLYHVIFIIVFLIN